jgi:hypothetical protein
MAWYPDFTRYEAFGPAAAASLFAVGWLKAGPPYDTGRVDTAVYSRLVELLKDPWQPAIGMGVHCCDLCLYDGPPGHRNLFIPAGDRAFICPELITHFMNAHGYRPPVEFRAAVLACPDMRSMSYHKAMLAAVRPLVKALRSAGIE